MRQFEPEIRPGEPSLRISDRPPENSVNLAFIDGPPLESKNTVELFSYSLGEGNLSYDNYQSELYVGTNRILRNKKDSAAIPIEDILVTNLYRIDGEKEVPLWYCYTPRFYHYEVNPPVAYDAANRLWYSGQNIKMLFQNTEITENFNIELVPTQVDHVYKINIYSNFTSSTDANYFIKYSRCNATGGNRRYGFTELYNCVPYYTYIGSAPEDVEQVNNAQAGERVFALSKLLDESGYEIHVPENISQVARNPIVFRWRAKGIFDGGSKTVYSPWKVEKILHKQSLYEEEYSDYRGEIRYVDEGFNCRKILASNSELLFDEAPEEVVVNHEIWDGNDWVADGFEKIVTEYDGTQITAYTTEATGEVSREPGTIEHSYRVNNTYLTIEGYIDPPVDEPAVLTNVAKAGKKAVATTDCNYSQFPIHSEPIDAIDGYELTLFKGLLGLKPITIPLPGSPSVGSASYSWHARSNEGTNPPTTPTTTTVTFDGIKNISKIRIAMGEKGTVTKIELLQSGDVSVDIPVPSPTASGTSRYYAWTGDPVPNCTGLRVTVAPSKWKTRDAKYFLWWKTQSARYQTGFDILEIDAYDFYDPAPLIWSRKVAIPISAKEDMPRQLNLRKLITDNGLVPPDDVPKENVRYRISFGDQTDIDAICDYNPAVSFDLKEISVPKGSLEDGTFLLSYNEIFLSNHFLIPEVEDSEVFFSRKFSIKSYSSTNIHLLPFDGLNTDEMWWPRIHNGRMLVENPARKLKYEYYIPEYGTQPFYPDLPYMYAEQESAEYLDDYTIRVSKTPMYVVCDEDGEPTGENGHYFLRVYTEDDTGKKIDYPINSWNIFTGEIRLGRRITMQDQIHCDYYYKQENYFYSGFEDPDTGRFYYLDLNPLPGHVCTYPLPDLTGATPEEPQELPTWEVLKDKAVYFYILPTFTYSTDLSVSEPPVAAEGSVLRHLIIGLEETPELPEGALLLGKVLLNNPVIPSVVKATDCRRRGGGFKDTLTIEAIRKKHGEAESIWDIGTFDGRPYPSNGVIEVTIPKSVLKENGGRFTHDDVEQMVNKYLAFGIYAFIQYK